MSTVEDFENAPVGATATSSDDGRAMKMDGGERRWVIQNGFYLADEEMEQRGYILDPLEPAPTTAREALDLAWELAHPVKDGQVIPVGTWLVDRRYNKFLVEKNTFFDIAVDEWGAENFRTLDPLPEPLPDWLDAPAVLAHVDDHNLQQQAVFTPTGAHPGRWGTAGTKWTFHWSELRGVTPLYPKEDA